VLTDPDGNIEYVNKKFTEATGYHLDEVVGQNPRILKSGHTPMEEYRKLWGNIKAGKEWRGEFYTRRKDGGCFWESALISPILNNHNQITHFLAVKEDITARKEAELELVRLNQELEDRVKQRTLELKNANLALEKASKLKDEFLASMSHELRTPLTGVLGLSEALQKGVYGDLNDKQVNILHTIEEGGRHLLNLINDILDLSKIEAGKMELQPSMVSVDEVCQASIRLVKQMATARRQKLTLMQDPPDMLMYADSKRMKQILVNLLGNAVKFTPDEGELGLEVTGDEKKDEVRFVVWDTGIGISPEDMEKLFQPFVQIDSSLSRTYGGTGLGLSLVDRLVKLHHGKVSVKSVVGKGSRFIVSIPWHLDMVNAETARRFDLATTVGSNSDKNILTEKLGSVLIVEDNEVNKSMLADFLTYNGFAVSGASNGQEGLALCQSAKPDIVLMDIQIPGVDGLQVIRSIRKLQGKISSVPIIAITALAMPEDRQRCLDAGANEYMSKPVDLAGLLDKIKELRRK
jgi:PAS domain S-box-containing protein